MDRGIAERAHDMEAVKDATDLYEVERRARHAVRPGFRITELQISPTQEVPWHYHTNVRDTFYVLSGAIQIILAPTLNRRDTLTAFVTGTRTAVTFASVPGISR